MGRSDSRKHTWLLLVLLAVGGGSCGEFEAGVTGTTPRRLVPRGITTEEGVPFADAWALFDEERLLPLGISPSAVAIEGNESFAAARAAADDLFDAWWAGVPASNGA